MLQLTAFALTLVVEATTAATVSPRFVPRSPIGLGAVALAASCLTHPVAWILNQNLAGTLGIWPSLILVEVFVVLTESFAYKGALGLPLPASTQLSLLANAASFSAGLIALQLGLFAHA